jgi:hypothetical protein
MEQNTIFREMPLTCLIANFTTQGGFERIYMATGRKADSEACNRLRNPKSDEKSLRNIWNGRVLHPEI